MRTESNTGAYSQFRIGPTSGARPRGVALRRADRGRQDACGRTRGGGYRGTV